MRARDITAALTAILSDGPPVLLWGSPGVGKSDIIAQTAAMLGWDMLVSHPVVDNPTDAKGFPWLTQDAAGQAIAEFVPFGTLRRAMAATTPTVWFLDDLGQAIPAVQGAYMQLVLARRINGHILPDCVRFVAASNRSEDRAGVSKMITPLLNRFCHLEMEVSQVDWQAWAVNHGIEPSIRAYLEWKPANLHRFDAGAGEKSFATPRSWEFASKHVKACPANVLLPVLAGDLGEGTAAEYISFRQVYLNLPNIDSLLANPSGVTLPQEPDVVFAMIGALVEKAKGLPASKLNAIGVIAGRMQDEQALLLVRDTMAVRPAEASSRSACPAIAGWIGNHLEIFASV